AEVDFGATLVQLQIAVRRIFEQDRRALDKSIIKGSLQIDLLVQEIGIERRHHLERAVHSLAADDPGARIDQQVGFQRFDIDHTVAEKVLNRHGGHDLVRSCGRDPSQRFVKRVDQRLYRRGVRGNELLPGIEHGRRVSAPEDAVVDPRESAIETIRIAPSRCRRVITGSRFEIASISPVFIASTARSPPPTPTKDASLGISSALVIRYSTKKWLEEFGAVTPIFRPLRSANDLKDRSLPTASPTPGKRPSSITARTSCPMACARNVCS